MSELWVELEARLIMLFSQLAVKILPRVIADANANGQPQPAEAAVKQVPKDASREI